MTLCVNLLWISRYKVILKRKNDIIVHGGNVLIEMTCNHHDSYYFYILDFDG